MEVVFPHHAFHSMILTANVEMYEATTEKINIKTGKRERLLHDRMAEEDPMAFL